MATVIIKDLTKLDKVLEAKIKFALIHTQKIIAQCIQESITEYYHEYRPEKYRRQYKFLNSLVSTDIVKKGNSYQCEVKIDESYLSYHYPDTGEFDPYLPATGLDVVTWANRGERGFGNHGGTKDAGRDEGFWDIGIRDLGGENGIIAILKSNLKKVGLIG